MVASNVIDAHVVAPSVHHIALVNAAIVLVCSSRAVYFVVTDSRGGDANASATVEL